METELINSLVILLVTIFLLGFAYYQQRKVEDKQKIINAVFKTAENLIIAGKDFKITEEEWQQIADDATKELSKQLDGGL